MKKSFTLAALAFSFLLSGCSNNTSSSSQKVEITLWHTFTEKHEEKLQEIVSAYNESQDQVTVVALTQPLDGFESKVYEAVSNGTGPNLVMLGASNAADYVAEGLAIDFSKYLDINEYQSRVNAGLFEESTGFAQEGWYCIANQSTGPVFFYDKTIYDELNLTAPKTWEDVEANSKVIYEKKGIPGFGVDSISDLGIMLLNQSGVGYINTDSGSVDWTSEKAQEVINWFADGVKAGYFQLKPSTGDYNSGDIGAHVLAAYIGSSAGLNFLDLGDHELVAVAVPQLGEGNDWVQLWSRNIIGFKGDEATEKAVADFAQYFISVDQATPWVITYGGYTPYSDVAATEDYQNYVAGNIALQALAAQDSYASALPVLSGSQTVRTELEKAITKVATGQASAKDALQEATTASNAALAQQ